MFDVVVIGEPLLEFATSESLATASEFRLSFSGDALNAAIAAAAAGARTALLTRVGADQLGDRLVAFAAGHGVDTSLITRDSAPTGAYLVGTDASFAYLRAGSAATGLSPSDVDVEEVRTAKALLCSGITAAISGSARSAVLHAAGLVRQAGGIVVYDPNFRPRLTTAEQAREVLAALAPWLTVVVPSDADIAALFGPGRSVSELGIANVVMTRGEAGVLLSTADGEVMLPAFAAPHFVDATGAGDSFAGTLTARLALGDSLHQSTLMGISAASLSVGGRGGTGNVPTLQQIYHQLKHDI